MWSSAVVSSSGDVLDDGMPRHSTLLLDYPQDEGARRASCGRARGPRARAPGHAAFPGHAVFSSPQA
ncbi:hypothetical protein OH787_01165 [Streptomyces sp. NBC_01547]|uniref:hypothetical protein n=1 Tax=unclassified Streptomyces TaxID=2593676 RepID=UPI003864ECDC